MLPNHQNTSLVRRTTHTVTTLLPLHWRKPTSDSREISTGTPLARECTMLYGVAENVHTTASYPLLKEKTSRPIDRTHHLEDKYLIFCRRKFITAINHP